ncbi:type II toxin-antitoxin system RelE/ParE family toxin [Mycobacteroides abscessus subsp. abscessus]|uniref:type II toxin-antitoxin system RelE family toxin n=1 Tax=Mycobacteroides abscessus TaxID=36809 RepID=UPI0009A835E2|nr:type II toxin-antitoxin system RelE/ParE family toxin [Mycobacteroides abscessus]MDO3146429.1 type II toxin-antitoxin system RelE/ParE family toxin [Mycobacteroides abscessus subsp. abscessus]SKE53392.1 Gp41 [Mycobacteroides abscessus subsp. massiliense]
MYEVEITESATKELVRIKRADGKLHRQILDALKGLATDPRPHGYIKLSGREGYRIRVRDYRILYSIDDGKLLILVVKVDKRGQVYR